MGFHILYPVSYVFYIFRSVHSLGVIIHETPIQNDLLLVGGQTLQIEGDLLHGAVLTDDLGGNGLDSLLHGGADTGDEDTVTHLVLEGGVLVESEGENTPVDAVAAVALCCKFIADVCKAAKHLLAGGCLLSC